jgi:hypothetical protein
MANLGTSAGVEESATRMRTEAMNLDMMVGTVEAMNPDMVVGVVGIIAMAGDREVVLAEMETRSDVTMVDTIVV